MKLNTAGQKIGAQMVTATDGSAFTGAVTVSVTGDAGTQATGSVGAGACTHEGNGYHTYAPAQAETNYALIAFTFTGTGAIPATVQVETSFPQTGDSFALIGATGSGLTSLASAANLAIVAAYVDTEVAAILAAVDTEVAAIKAKTDQLTFTTANKVDGTIQAAADFAQAAADKAWSTTTRQLTGTQAFALTGNITGNLSGSVGSVTGAVGSVTGAVGSVTANVTMGGTSAGALTDTSVTTALLNLIADMLLDRNMATGTDSGSPTVRTPRQALRAIRNKASIAAGTLTVSKEDDTTASWTAAVTTTAGNPVSAIDPA